MKRAFLIELTIFRDYGKQLLALGVLVSILIGLGTGTALATPAVLACMFFMMGAMSAAAYDEQNDWALFRLTMPLSRRDVVLGRYAAIAVLGLAGAATGIAVAVVLSAVAGTVGLPGNLAQTFLLDGDQPLAMAFATAFCVLVGATVAAVVTPIYFRLGQTKATQLLPTIIVMLFVVPVVLLGNSGLLDAGELDWQWLVDILSYIETPLGVAVGCTVMLAAAAAVLGISTAVSLKLYEGREL